MLSARRSRGFTLIELVVTMAVAAILIVLGIPEFSAWIHDEEIRTTAEAMQNGLRLSEEEALSRNRQVVFALTNAAPALNAPSAADGRTRSRPRSSTYASRPRPESPSPTSPAWSA